MICWPHYPPWRPRLKATNRWPISKRTQDLLMANRKTPREFLKLVIASPFSLFDIEEAFLEVQSYKSLEESIVIAAKLNISVIAVAYERCLVFKTKLALAEASR